jgi:beta-glucosidase
MSLNEPPWPHPGAFPAGFLFGAGTSAYQIEGGAGAQGRGPSWWDHFAHQPGNTVDGSHGDIACDHHRLWRQDLDLMQSLGLGAYRFSIAWPRVLPEGRGRVNAAGLDFYERLVDGLLARGIAPCVTLYHWDLPLALARSDGSRGWQSRDTAAAFADYALLVMRRLGDRVASWATLNEPRCCAWVGHFEGRHAPGLQGDLRATLAAAHHQLLGHGLAVQALRAERPGARLGIVLDLKPHQAASPQPQDQAAAWRGDGVFNRWFLDPLFRASYPADVAEACSACMPAMQPGDLRTIATPIDELGINYYTRAVVAHAPDRPWPSLAEQRVDGRHHSTMGWEDFPEGLEQTLLRVQRDYAPPAVYIAENGCAEPDQVSADGRVRDPDRQAYLRGHVQACARALAQGVPLRAYLAWSLMDNFEWGRGYTQRFGLVHVDYASQARTVKDSGADYAAFIAPFAGGQRR